MCYVTDGDDDDPGAADNGTHGEDADRENELINKKGMEF